MAMMPGWTAVTLGAVHTATCSGAVSGDVWLGGKTRMFWLCGLVGGHPACAICTRNEPT